MTTALPEVALLRRRVVRTRVLTEEVWDQRHISGSAETCVDKNVPLPRLSLPTQLAAKTGQVGKSWRSESSDAMFGRIKPMTFAELGPNEPAKPQDGHEKLTPVDRLTRRSIELNPRGPRASPRKGRGAFFPLPAQMVRPHTTVRV